MNRSIIVDLFVEDRAHEEFLKPLITRVASEENIEVTIRVRSARGGHGKAISEYKLYQDMLEEGLLGEIHPDLMIVAIDGNCTPWAKKRDEIKKETKELFSNRLVSACPNPHIEHWYLADPDSFFQVVGYRPVVGKRKCIRDYYKNAMVKAIRAAGHPITLGGIEFASEIVMVMDFYRAGKNDNSLGALLEELRGKLRQQCEKG